MNKKYMIMFALFSSTSFPKGVINAVAQDKKIEILNQELISDVRFQKKTEITYIQEKQDTTNIIYFTPQSMGLSDRVEGN